MIVRRYFARLRAAEAFQWRLYDRYDHVQCVGQPHGEAGWYAWEVR